MIAYFAFYDFGLKPKEKHVYSREKLFEIRDTMPESLNSPPNIDKNLESEVMTMLFGDNR
mgnify:CR=1